MSRPLKVYYCNDCGFRMPLYYKKGAPFRDEHWHTCYHCKSKNIISQTETWDFHREKAAKLAVTRAQLDQLRRNARTWQNNPTIPGRTANQNQSGEFWQFCSD